MGCGSSKKAPDGNNPDAEGCGAKNTLYDRTDVDGRRISMVETPESTIFRDEAPRASSKNAAGGDGALVEEPPAWSHPVKLKPYKTKKAVDGQGAVVTPEGRGAVPRSESTSSHASTEYKASLEGRTHAPASGESNRPGTNSPTPALPATELPTSISTESKLTERGSVPDYSVVRAGPPGKKRVIKPAHLSDSDRPNRHPSAKAKPKPRALQYEPHRQPLLKGKCFVCKKPVFDTQPRIKEEQKGYRHETCITLSEGVADAALSNASTHKAMADVRAAEKERIEAERVAMEQASLAMRERMRKNADLRKKSQELIVE